LVAFLALLPIHRVRGQDAFVEAETRVRVRAGEVGPYAGSPGTLDSRLVGHLEGTSGDSLWIRVGSTDGPLVSFDRANIQQLQISDGRKRNTGKGALWGAGVGLGLGVLAVAALDDCTMGYGRFWFDFCEGEEDVLILGSIAAGAALGAVVGFLIKSARWVTVPPASVTLGRDRGGVTLGFQMQLGF
jgi:hypothetical protein